MGDTFESLGLPSWLIKQTTNLGLKSPTPIQQNCIPHILAGKDCIGAAKTGSGKTFAFALPILQRLSDEPTSHFALVLTPTHELAYQIAEQFSVAGAPMGCRVCVVAGGTDQMIESQKLSQQRPHIVVAMPGRLADHLTGCDTFSFNHCQFLVIDEADRMLEGCFDESLITIMEHLPQKRQTLLFSATLKDELVNSNVLKLREGFHQFMEDSPVATVATLDQRYLLCADYDRDMVLIEAVRQFQEENKNNSKATIMIFTNTKKYCQLLSMTMNACGLTNVCLHGFLRQKERAAALNQFKSKHVRILIATDVASRGLDIDSVQLVVNHRLPKMTVDYIHRVGRTARAGRAGRAISIFRFPRDLPALAEIEEAVGLKLTEHPVDQRLVERIFMQVSVSRREAEMQLDNQDFDERTSNYRRKKWIEDGLDPDEMEKKFKESIEEKKREQRKRPKSKYLSGVHEEREKQYQAYKKKKMENGTEGDNKKREENPKPLKNMSLKPGKFVKSTVQGRKNEKSNNSKKIGKGSKFNNNLKTKIKGRDVNVKTKNKKRLIK